MWGHWGIMRSHVAQIGRLSKRHRGDEARLEFFFAAIVRGDGNDLGVVGDLFPVRLLDFVAL